MYCDPIDDGNPPPYFITGSLNGEIHFNKVQPFCFKNIKSQP